jgi:hypothetical protein
MTGDKGFEWPEKNKWMPNDPAVGSVDPYGVDKADRDDRSGETDRRPKGRPDPTATGEGEE